MNFLEYYLKEDSVLDNPSFKAWFGNSQLVNADGTPKIMYHGSNSKFDTFNYEHLGNKGRSEGAGFYFTDDEDIAKGYGNIVYKAYLKIEKPLDTNYKNFSRAVIQKIIKKIVELEQQEGIDPQSGFLSNFGDIDYEGFNSVLNQAVNNHVDEENATDFQGSLIGAGVDPLIVNKSIYHVTGYDGILSHGFGGLKQRGGIIYIPFFPNQIKSINNTKYTDSDNIYEGK